MTSNNLRYLNYRRLDKECQVFLTENNNNSIAIDSKAKDLTAIERSYSYREESKADKNKKIEANAVQLMQKLRAEPQWLRFFCKVLYTLPEGTIAYILEGATKAQYPQRYFCSSASREMKKTT